MPRPVYTDADFDNPDAPENERCLREGHPEVRDLSYDVGRHRQRLDLFKGAIVQTNIDGLTGDEPPDELPPGEADHPRLELFLKERSRGYGYVCDFIYESVELPVTIYGTLVNHGRGLVINEMELWRGGLANRWEYRDAWGDYVGPDGVGLGQPDDLSTYTGITPTLLRQLPLGQIVAAAGHRLARRDWDDEGVYYQHGLVDPEELPAESQDALERGAEQGGVGRKGRPERPDVLLAEVAHAYLAEAPSGVGLTRRLAERFDRPEPTIRDWVAAARRRGFLSPAQPGKRGAAPGPRLSDAAAETVPPTAPKPPVGFLDEDSDDQLPLSHDAFMLFTSAMVNANRDGHPGFVANSYLEAIPAEPTLAIFELRALGLWKPVTGGYQILDTDAVERCAERSRQRKELRHLKPAGRRNRKIGAGRRDKG